MRINRFFTSLAVALVAVALAEQPVVVDAGVRDHLSLLNPFSWLSWSRSNRTTQATNSTSAPLTQTTKLPMSDKEVARRYDVAPTASANSTQGDASAGSVAKSTSRLAKELDRSNNAKALNHPPQLTSLVPNRGKNALPTVVVKSPKVPAVVTEPTTSEVFTIAPSTVKFAPTTTTVSPIAVSEQQNSTRIAEPGSPIAPPQQVSANSSNASVSPATILKLLTTQKPKPASGPQKLKYITYRIINDGKELERTNSTDFDEKRYLKFSSPKHQND